MTESKIRQKCNKPTVYVVPSFERHQLSTITLGGSPGSGDSGAPNSQSPFGEDSTGARDEKQFEEGWEDEV